MEVSTLMVGWGWSYDELKAGWQEIEALGYDACYLGDDLFPHYFEDDPASAQARVQVYDPWTVLAAMAETTERMRIGTLVTPCRRRHPSVFAKITTLVDIISGGRLTVGLGAGNSPDQTLACGLPLLGATERSTLLEEEVRILESLWTEERTSFEGDYYTVRELVNFPKPVRKPRPEILFGFGSPKFLTRLAAEFADRINLFGDAARSRAALDALKAHCEDLGRSYDAIVKSCLSVMLFTDHEVPPEERSQVITERARLIGRDPEEMLGECERMLTYVGPPKQCAESVLAYMQDLGLTELVICPDTIGELSHERTMAGLRTFAAEVMPALKAA